MHTNFLFILGLLLLILFCITLANKMRIAYPILLVLAGLGVSFIPNLPHIELEPELVFVIFLPPLLFEAAFTLSLKTLWKIRRMVFCFAFVVVLFSAILVAIGAYAMIPGFTLALGFVLGAIVSPPDAVSASAITKFVRIPHNLGTFLEGESLFNDASSLIILKFALIAVATGQFSWMDASTDFIWMVLGGAAVGVLVALIYTPIHRYLVNDPNVHILLSLTTPYVMYIGAESVGASGVLSVVCGGLLLSRFNPRLMDFSTRIHGRNIWGGLVFLINGIVFILIGLQLPELLQELKHEQISTQMAILYGLGVSAILIVARLIACITAYYTTLYMRHRIGIAYSNPQKRWAMLLSWTGMRGIVSLAAGLSIPLLLESGEPFPYRALILFITFVVILTTLILQGLSLPYLIQRYSKPEDNEDHSAHYTYLREGMEQVRLRWLEKHQEEELTEVEKLQAICRAQRMWLEVENMSNPEIEEEVVRHYFLILDIEEQKLHLCRDTH